MRAGMSAAWTTSPGCLQANCRHVCFQCVRSSLPTGLWMLSHREMRSVRVAGCVGAAGTQMIEMVERMHARMICHATGTHR